MKRTTLIAAACALLVVTAGVTAAVPGNAPADAGENGVDERDDRSENGADERDDRRGNAAGERGGNAAAAGNADERGGGPNVELPAQVPDHVSAIHERISSFLDGSLEGTLGDAISEVTPDDDESDEGDRDGDASDADATVDETPDEETTDEETDDEETTDEETDDDEDESSNGGE